MTVGIYWVWGFLLHFLSLKLDRVHSLFFLNPNIRKLVILVNVWWLTMALCVHVSLWLFMCLCVCSVTCTDAWKRICVCVHMCTVYRSQNKAEFCREQEDRTGIWAEYKNRETAKWKYGKAASKWCNIKMFVFHWDLNSQSIDNATAIHGLEQMEENCHARSPVNHTDTSFWVCYTLGEKMGVIKSRDESLISDLEMESFDMHIHTHTLIHKIMHNLTV